MKTLTKEGLSISFLIIGILIIQRTGHAQKEVPNYVFAENVKSLVVINSNLDFENYVPTFKTTVDLEEEVSNLDEALWEEIVRMVLETLEGVNIKPAGVIGIDQAQLAQNPKSIYEIFNKELLEIKPYYYIRISFVDENRIKRKYKSQKKLTATDIKEVMFTINTANPRSTDKVFAYMIRGLNLSLDRVISKFEKDVQSKPSSYFLKKIDDERIKENEENTLKGLKVMKASSSLKTVGKEHNSFPSDITEKKILVTHDFMTNTGIKGLDNSSNKNIEELKKYLDKFYKGEYKLIFKRDYAKELGKGDYKYALTPFNQQVVKTTTTTTREGLSSFPKTERDSRLATEYFYVVKNIKTDEVYYGPDKDKLQKKAGEAMAWSIKATLKIMAQYYGWED